MMLRLREYQTRTLATLERYFDRAATSDAKTAFIYETERPYHSVPKLAELPYVCLRVPTGGGKTIMAAHAVGIAAEHWVRRDSVVCLWLVPSDAIREQTLMHLRTEGDPYRDALLSRFSGAVTVMDLGEALGMHRAVADGGTVVIVSTLAALRVNDTQGRKVYESNGALQDHFTGVSPELLRGLDQEGGLPKPSLANALALRRPVVIMDEAHNARTPLSFETLTRFAPSCVIEFTATPQREHRPDATLFASNVLAHVSAAELKAEEMIKLPVQLSTRPTWTDAVTDALHCQRTLEEAAAAEVRTGDSRQRIRPIVLFQAQPNRQDGSAITADRLRTSLVDDHRIPEEQIAVATGRRRELDDVDLADPTCPIRYVITVQALREGWDCPNAYVLCSIAEQTGARAVEQILGRILRMPGARRHATEALNESYAYVVSQGFAHAAAGLRDALIENGFERYEAESVLRQAPTAVPTLFHARADAPVQMAVSEVPGTDTIPTPLLGIVRFDVPAKIVTVSAPLDDAATAALESLFVTPEGKGEARRLARMSRGEMDALPSSSAATVRTPLVLPQLAIERDGVLEMFEDSHFSDVEWRVSDCDPAIAYPPARHAQAGATGLLDITDRGELRISFGEQIDEQLSLLEGEPGWTVPALTVWLDRHIAHPDLTQRDVALFVSTALSRILDSGDVALDRLAHDKYLLRRVLATRIEEHRAAQRGSSFQAVLFGGAAGTIQVTPHVSIILDDSARYAPNYVYDGAYGFRHHVFPYVGELKSDGAEFECAVYLDEHPAVECWVRNLSGRARDSFWLQTSTDRYYPDFVGRLRDGRVFAVEYKGGHLWTADDAREKRRVGALWQELSAGSCIHIMPQDRDWTALDAAFTI